MLNNTVLVTLPCLIAVTVIVASILHAYSASNKAAAWSRWLVIIAGVCAIAMPSIAAIASAVIGGAGAVLLLLMARNYAQVASGKNAASAMYAKAIGIAVLGLIPLAITTRLIV